MVQTDWGPVVNWGLFSNLAASIHGRWNARNYDEDWFPEIVETALQDFTVPEFDPGQFLSAVATTDVLPFQVAPRSAFGEPPITVYYSDRFYMELLYWFDGTTDIHQHCFSGAFKVLSGSSIHALYDFAPRQRISSRMIIGEVAFKRIEWLKVGAVRRILSGTRLIHSLFHLARPSVTLVVRTHGERDRQPQYTYLRPFVAVDSASDDVVLRRRLLSLRALRSVDHAKYEEASLHLLRTSDFRTALTFLQQHNVQSSPPDDGHTWRSYEAAIRERHGALWEVIPPLLLEWHRQNEIKTGRAQIVDPDVRFVLAALLNAPNRSATVELLRQRFENAEPADLIVDAVQHVAAARSSSEGARRNGRLVDLADDELLILRKVVEGRSDAEIIADLAEEFGVEEVHEQHSDVIDCCSRLRAEPLLKSFLV